MGSNNIVGTLDTNILVRMATGDLPEQVKKIDRLLQEGGVLSVPDTTMSECIYVLETLYKFTRQEVKQVVLFFIENTQIRCNKILFSKIMPLYVASPQLSVIDCMNLEYARIDQNLPLYTFDKKLVSKSEGDAVSL